MKTQNNNSVNPDTQSCQMAVKSRFFAQYWGTKTLYIGGVGKVEVGKGGWNLKHPSFFLQLKPLSKITDDDVQELLPLVSFDFSPRYTDEQMKEEIKKSVLDTEMMPSELFDFLRSKGYALPYMNYSVDNLISFGWVQLL